jgi:NAD+ kinase
VSTEKTQAARSVRTVALVTHSHPPIASGAVATAVSIAEQTERRMVASGAEVAKHEGAAEGIEVTEAMPENPDLCLVLGGDGSILWALRQYAGTAVPVFGINFGTVGFLAAAERADLETALRKAFAAEFEVLEIPGLEVSAESFRGAAFNDVTFSRLPHGRVAELRYEIAGEEVGNVRCDGLVAATPTGSTGYNLANGGPILAWGVEGYVVSYIAPHTLTARPLVVAPGDVLRVGNGIDREPVDLALDGEAVDRLAPGAEAEVSFRDGLGRLAQLPGSSFYRRLDQKFGHLAH